MRSFQTLAAATIFALSGAGAAAQPYLHIGLGSAEMGFLGNIEAAFVAPMTSTLAANVAGEVQSYAGGGADARHYLAHMRASVSAGPLTVSGGPSLVFIPAASDKSYSAETGIGGNFEALITVPEADGPVTPFAGFRFFFYDTEVDLGNTMVTIGVRTTFN